MLLLGAFLFQEFEIPANINFGGAQKLNIHKLIGGNRVIDAMGPDDAPITWAGRFQGEGAQDRCNELMAMKDAGQEIPLYWDGNFYLVVISAFKANHERTYQITYTISCEVSSKPSRDNVAGAVNQALSSLVGSDLSSLGGVMAVVTDVMSIASVAAMTAAIGSPAALDTASSIALGAMIPPIANAVNTLSDASDALNTPIETQPDTTTVPQLVVGLTRIGDDMTQQQALLHAQDYSTRMGVNIGIGAANG